MANKNKKKVCPTSVERRNAMGADVALKWP